jgi:hypothetical protein
MRRDDRLLEQGWAGLGWGSTPKLLPSRAPRCAAISAWPSTANKLSSAPESPREIRRGRSASSCRCARILNLAAEDSAFMTSLADGLHYLMPFGHDGL